MVKHLAQFVILVLVIGWARGFTRAGGSWNGQPYTLDLATHISGVNQSPSSSINLSLQHDTAITIMVSPVMTGSEVLTLNGNTLTTSYMLTGIALGADADSTWVSSTDFLTHIYHIAGTGPMDTLTLAVKATSPTNTVLPAGVYSASIMLTASW